MLPERIAVILAVVSSYGFAQKARQNAADENVTALDVITVGGVTLITGTNTDPGKLL
ncbi:MAG: hypothetical protein ABI304_14900 [Rudaea sp.]